MPDKVIVIIKDERPSVPEDKDERPSELSRLADIVTGNHKSEQNDGDGSGGYSW